MKVVIDLPMGGEGWSRDFEMDSPPRIGDSVSLDGDEWRVRHVAWYPSGDEDDPTPFVLVVLQP